VTEGMQRAIRETNAKKLTPTATANEQRANGTLRAIVVVIVIVIVMAIRLIVSMSMSMSMTVATTASDLANTNITPSEGIRALRRYGVPTAGATVGVQAEVRAEVGGRVKATGSKP